jgi:modulator of FtsH protease HflC
MSRRARFRWLLKRLAVATAGFLFIWSAFYRVGESDQAIVTQFGDPIGGPITSPGLHLKVPLIQTVTYFDKRFLEYEHRPTQVPTKDKRYLSVVVFGRWRVSDPLKFFQRVQNEDGARARLAEILDGEIRNAVAQYDLVELVRSTNRGAPAVLVESDEDAVILQPIARGRPRLAREVLERAAARAAGLGIEILDVRFKRLSYVEEVQKAVFARMIAERQRIAQQILSQGQGEAARISGERERDLAKIQSEAYRTAEQARGKAEADATQIYAAAYGRDPDFYAFVKSLETYERSLDPNTIMVLDGSSDLMKYLSKSR